MPRLIRDHQIVADDWQLMRELGDAIALPLTGNFIVPLSYWVADRDRLLRRGGVGVLLAPADDPHVLAKDCSRLPVIAIDFPQFTDGRGYSSARLLRERYGFRGELRAVGDILRDQLYYLEHCGFNAFAVRADRDIDDALLGLNDFSDGYQVTTRRTLPLRWRHVAP